MVRHTDITQKELLLLIKAREISLGGNSSLKIYGTLQCSSGKRLKAANRVFFTSEKEAIALGFRPCGHCMNASYKSWKINNYPQFGFHPQVIG